MLKIASLLGAAAAAAMIGITALAPALAQQAQTAGIVTFDLFTEDSVDLEPSESARLLDAVHKAQAPGDCPLGRITIITPEGDPLFQEALGKARRDVVLQFLDLNGIDASRFFADSIVFGVEGPGNDAQLEYLRDDIAPKLDTNSTPPKGTKVKEGDKIKVTMIARDHANLRQSGIKTIQLVAESDGGRFIASENFPPVPPGCDRLPPDRRVEATYTVPSNPPPMVRLGALAEDHAGLMDTDAGEFPTEVAPCVGGAWWVGAIRGIHKPSWGHQIKRSAESVRLCEGPLDLSYLIKGQAYYINLLDDGSMITYVHKDVGDPCRISGQGTTSMNREVGVISSILEEVGENGELRWSEPTYWLSAALAGTYTYTEICTYGTGTQTNTYPAGDGGWPINIGMDSYDPQSGNRKLEGGRMAGSYATPDGITASWSLSRQGGAPLFPANSAGQVIE
jgi:hypothetical protein